MGHFWDRPAPRARRAPTSSPRMGPSRGRSTGRLRPAPAALVAGAVRDLGVARNSVADAYSQLVAEGWLTARRAPARTSPSARRRRPRRPAGSRRRRALQPARPARPTSRPFRGGPGSPPPAGARARRGRTLGYGDPRGRPELARRLPRTSRACAASVQHPSASSSARASPRGCGCSARRSAPGAGTLAVESYGHRHRARGERAAGSAVRRGRRRWRRAQLAAADVALLTPAHHSRSGPARRAAPDVVVEWAPNAGGLIVEDDYDGEFRYDRQAVGALQALAPDRVVYAGTASKTLAPAVACAGSSSRRSRRRRRFGEAAHRPPHRASSSSHWPSWSARAPTTATCAEAGSSTGAAATALWPRSDAADPLSPGIAAACTRVVLPQATERTRRRAGRGAGPGPRGARCTARREIQPPGLVVGYATPAEHAFTAAVARLAAVLRDATR